MPATRSRASTEQPAEVAAEEVKQVEDGTEIVTQVTVQPTEVVKSAETAVVPESESGAAAAEVQEQPAVVEEPVAVPVVADVVTNGSAVAAETNGASAEVTNGSAVVTNGTVEVPAEQESVPDAASEQPVSDGKRKSEVGGDVDVVPDSTDVKKQKVVQSEAEAAVVAEDPVTEATA